MPRKAYLLGCYYLSWLGFALFGIALNLACAPLLLLPPGLRPAAAARRGIAAAFRLWRWWLRLSGVLRVDWIGFEGGLEPGAVYVANHPTLIDATLLLSRLPDAVCAMKPALLGNPAVAAAARLAGYVSADGSVDAVRDPVARLGEGASFLIFPEGSRTSPGSSCDRIKPAFALIAQRARAPIRLILIRASPKLAPKGRPWYAPPPGLPARISFELDRRWAPDPGRSVAEIVSDVENRLRFRLG